MYQEQNNSLHVFHIDFSIHHYMYIPHLVLIISGSDDNSVMAPGHDTQLCVCAV